MEKMGWNAPLKKAKIEEDEILEEVEVPKQQEYGGESIHGRMEREKVLEGLIENRIKEIHHIQQIIDFHTSRLNYAKRRLEESQIQLARLRGEDDISKPSNNLSSENDNVDIDCEPASSVKMSYNSFGKHENDLVECGGIPRKPTCSKPQLVIPSKPSQETQSTKSGTTSLDSDVPTTATAPTHINVARKKRVRYAEPSLEQEALENHTKPIKVAGQKEHDDLTKIIWKSSSPVAVHCQSSSLMASQHKRRLRSLALCPTNEPLFVTSALDGIVNLWQVQGRGSGFNLLSSTSCSSNKQMRWPEDITWHPRGDRVFSVYSADGGDSQVSTMFINKEKKADVHYLEDQPHVKGIINCINFMPWDESCFVTGGSDHAVVLWSEKDGKDLWKAGALHRHNHSSAVMGVAGLQHKSIILSAGADKRIIGFDVASQQLNCKYQLESKCMDVLPNPRDFNLIMVQTGTQEQQIRLFDMRSSQGEIHAFGFKQESSDSQSALIKQCWSPDGLYLSSGSVDPVIHIFDIRYNARKPCHAIRSHQKRVFKASWHHSLPILISISSDLNVGLHNVTSGSLKT